MRRAIPEGPDTKPRFASRPSKVGAGDIPSNSWLRGGGKGGEGYSSFNASRISKNPATEGSGGRKKSPGFQMSLADDLAEIDCPECYRLAVEGIAAFALDPERLVKFEAENPEEAAEVRDSLGSCSVCPRQTCRS